MPRKQRFKPSRKPKPVGNPLDAQQIGTATTSRDERFDAEHHRGAAIDIESGGPARSRADNSAAVDDGGSQAHG